MYNVGLSVAASRRGDKPADNILLSPSLTHALIVALNL